MPIFRVVTLPGVAALVSAPFGAFAFSLSTIIAAICMGSEAHPDLKKHNAFTGIGGMLWSQGVGERYRLGSADRFPALAGEGLSRCRLVGQFGGGLHLVSA
jgi:benzoate membrane transport protein